MKTNSRSLPARTRWAASVAGLALIASSLAASAWAQGAGGPGAGPGMGHHGMGRHGGPGGGEGAMGMMLSPRMLDAVKATPEQRAQLKQIMDRARADMATQRDAQRALRNEALAVFTATTVDANAAEAVRKKMIAAHDQASQRRMQAMVEASRVLSPEQRKQMADLAKRRGEMMERHRRERDSLAPKG